MAKQMARSFPLWLALLAFGPIVADSPVHKLAGGGWLIAPSVATPFKFSVGASGFDGGNASLVAEWTSAPTTYGRAAGHARMTNGSLGFAFDCDIDGWFYDPNWAPEVVFVGIGAVSTANLAAENIPCSVRHAESDSVLLAEWHHPYIGGGIAAKLESGHLDGQ